MSKALGIHLSDRRFYFVALDGTYKRPKLRAQVSGIAARPEEGSDALDALGEALKSSAKEHRKAVESDNIGLAVDSSLATFRQQSLPFAEASKIEEVLKFEVEGQLPQWDIDSVVVDFHTIKGSPVESQLLISAVPKDELGRRIELAARAGLEPFDAELEATALFRAAEQQELLPAEGGCLLVHFGAHTTTLATVIDGTLAAVRAVHIDLESFDAGAAAESESAAESAEHVGAPDEERAQAVRARIQRELARTINSVQSDLTFDSILVCGIDVPELVGSEAQGAPIRWLDPLEGMTDLEPAHRRRLVVAYGTALGRLGGGSVKPHLRREELTYASRFERLELPLGVFGLLLLTLLASQFIINQKVIVSRSQDVESWLKASRNYMIGQYGTDIVGALRPRAEEYESDPLYRYVEQIASEGDPTRDYAGQLARVSSLIGQKIRGLEEDLGAARDLTLPQSAMTGLNLVLDVLRKLDEEGSVGRFSIRSVDAEYVESARQQTGDHVLVDLDLTFFGANDLEGSRSFSALFTELESQPWVVEEIKRPSTTPLADGKGIYLNGLKIKVDTTLAEVEG
jgi:Tfp pilus assembly PilM family ATPase